MGKFTAFFVVDGWSCLFSLGEAQLFHFFTLQRISANFALGIHLPGQPEDLLLVQWNLLEANVAYFLPGINRLM